jgi:hypothetical protein
MSKYEESKMKTISDSDGISNILEDLWKNYKQMEKDYKLIMDYYGFSKQQHEDILEYLDRAETSLNKNNEDISGFIAEYAGDISQKLKRIIHLETVTRENQLSLK